MPSTEFGCHASRRTSVEPAYGFVNWCPNTDKKYYPEALAAAFVHVGNGTNIIYIDSENDIVIVARWTEGGKVNQSIVKVTASLKN